MPEGSGTISCCLKDERRNDIDYVLVSIADTGVGVPEAAQPYIFEISNPLGDRDKTKSFSFGLAWARLFLRSFKGDIWYETDKGGTTFYILVPREFSRKWLS
jgi:signal transduction histidine kinase